MADFEGFYSDLLDLAEKYGRQSIPIKVEQDLENGIIKILGQRISPLARAKNGLADVAELAHAASEHHPYWNMLHCSSELSYAVLEKWDSSLSPDDLSEMEWNLKKIRQSVEKIKAKMPGS